MVTYQGARPYRPETAQEGRHRSCAERARLLSEQDKCPISRQSIQNALGPYFGLNKAHVP